MYNCCTTNNDTNIIHKNDEVCNMAKHAMKHAAWHVASGDQQLIDYMVAQTGQEHVYLMEAVKTQIHLF
eukprot:scaffold63425_cov56-Attheya_sp.AAC.1